MFRLLNKIYANLFGYFWLPCPSCGKMFGGHEVRGIKSIFKNGRTYCVCPNCQNNPSIEGYIPTIDLTMIMREIKDKESK